MKMKKTTVFFDLDNTLIDRNIASQAAYHNWAKKCFPNDESWQEKLYHEMLIRDDNGDVEKYKQFQEVRDVLNLPWEWIDETVAYWYSEYPKQAISFPQSRRTVSELKKRYKVGVISNGDVVIQGKKMDIVGLKDLFDVILYSGELGLQKPNPKVFLEACKRIGCKPEEAYYVGDIPWRDVAGSRKVGMTPIYIWRDDSKPCPGVIHIHQIQDLLDII